MSVQPLPRSTSPCDAILTAPLRARAALTERPPRALDAVAWLSAHLSTVERTLLPRVRAVLGEDERVADLRHLGSAVYVAARRLEQAYAGDALLRRLDVARLRASALEAIDAYAEAEHRLVCQLSDRLDERERAELATSYLDTLTAAPTRPHPHVPHRGLLGALAFRVDAVWDRFLNTLDSRSVPIPRQRATKPAPGRWSSYALGTPLPASDEAHGQGPA